MARLPPSKTLVIAGGGTAVTAMTTGWTGLASATAQSVAALAGLVTVVGIGVQWREWLEWIKQTRREGKLFVLIGTIVTGVLFMIFCTALIRSTFADPETRPGSVKQEAIAKAQGKPKTLHQLYEDDFKLSSVRVDGEMFVPAEAAQGNDSSKKLGTSVLQDWIGMTKFVAVYMPSRPDGLIVARSIPYLHQSIIDHLSGDDIQMQLQRPGEVDHIDAKDLTDTKAVYLYYAGEFSLKEASELSELFRGRGLKLVLRTSRYAIVRSLQDRTFVHGQE